MSNENLVINFANPQVQHWDVINDSVMGGLSKGHAQHQALALRFYGLISTDNNGGFTSAYSERIQLSKGINSVSITAKGDGNTYQLRLRTKMQGRELIYKASFNTKVNQTETYCFHFSDFKASFRGTIIDNAPQLEAENISNVGFLITLKQKKMFLLSVEKIEFYMCK